MLLEKCFPPEICMIIYNKLLPVQEYNNVMLDLVREASVQKLIRYNDDFMLDDFVIQPSYIKISDEILAGYGQPFTSVKYCSCTVPYYGWVEKDE